MGQASTLISRLQASLAPLGAPPSIVKDKPDSNEPDRPQNQLELEKPLRFSGGGNERKRDRRDRHHHGHRTCNPYPEFPSGNQHRIPISLAIPYIRQPDDSGINVNERNEVQNVGRINQKVVSVVRR